MIERTEDCFGIKPSWLAGDTAYGSGPNLDWLVNEKEIAPHVPVIDKSNQGRTAPSRVKTSATMPGAIATSAPPAAI